MHSEIHSFHCVEQGIVIQRLHKVFLDITLIINTNLLKKMKDGKNLLNR